jgi:hypothetical protein
LPPGPDTSSSACGLSAQALGEQLAQPRARHDEAPAVALEAQPQRPAALGVGQQFPHRAQRLRSLVQPGGNHLDHVSVNVCLRQPM